MSDVKKMILKYGYDKQRTGTRTTSAKVICQGCGEYISSDDDLTDVQYTISKRKTFTAFHGKCFEKVWDSKIKYHGTETAESSRPTSKAAAKGRRKRSKAATT